MGQKKKCGCKDDCPHNGGGEGSKVVCIFKQPTSIRIKKVCPDHPGYHRAA